MTTLVREGQVSLHVGDEGHAGGAGPDLGYRRRPPLARGCGQGQRDRAQLGRASGVGEAGALTSVGPGSATRLLDQRPPGGDPDPRAAARRRRGGRGGVSPDPSIA